MTQINKTKVVMHQSKAVIACAIGQPDPQNPQECLGLTVCFVFMFPGIEVIIPAITIERTTYAE